MDNFDYCCVVIILGMSAIFMWYVAPPLTGMCHTGFGDISRYRAVHYPQIDARTYADLLPGISGDMCSLEIGEVHNISNIYYVNDSCRELLNKWACPDTSKTIYVAYSDLIYLYTEE